MRSAPALLLGLLLTLPSQVRATEAPAAWSAEVGADSGRLVLVWPVPTQVTLAVEDGFVRLRAERPISSPPPAVTTQLSLWLSHAATRGSEVELAMRLRPAVSARLLRPHPRLTVVEFGRNAPLAAPAPAPPSVPTPAMPELAAIEPAVGPARAMLIPRSRPQVGHVNPSPPPATVIAVAAGPQGRAAVGDPISSAAGVTVAAVSHPGELEIGFRWNRAVPAAMFERGGQLWVVFPDGDAAVAGWRSLARAEVTAWLEPVATTAGGGTRVFRFRLPRPVRIKPVASASGWTIAVTEIGAVAHHDAAEVALERVPARGMLIAHADGQVVQLRDPESGERLDALLATDAGLRQNAPARLVDLELLPSLQGLVWRLLADGVRATVADGRLVITRPGGLRLSAAATEPTANEAAGEGNHPLPRDAHPPKEPSVGNIEDTAHAAHGTLAPPTTAVADQPALRLGLAEFAGLDAVGRQHQRRRIAGDLRSLDGLPRAKARLEIARLYLADALGAEARTALELIDDADLAAPAAGPLRTSRMALTGAAEALAGRHDPALANLLDHALDEDAEIALWRAYAAAQAARWQLLAQEWARSGGLPAGYPDPLRRRLGLELAATLLDHGDATEARALLAQLGGIVLAGEDGARLSLLEGIARSRDGMPGEAEAAFVAARAQGDDDISVRAGFLLTAARAESGSLSPEAAITALALERPRWRGHAWEARMLTRLAELQAAAGRTTAAIATRAEAIARTPDPTAAVAARGEFRRYLGGQLADGSTTAVARLALYRAHGALLDDDPTAPHLRAGLAQVAATAGLTETAADLLDGAGAVPEAEAGRQALAAALAARGDIDDALRRLPEARDGENPSTARLRAELRARAALAQGDAVKAGAALASAEPISGRALEREIAWRSGDWQEMARTSGAELAATDASKPLSVDQADAAIWLGLAQARLGHAGEAAAVAARYVPGSTLPPRRRCSGSRP